VAHAHATTDELDDLFCRLHDPEGTVPSSRRFG
jgi:hypothetical protein